METATRTTPIQIFPLALPLTGLVVAVMAHVAAIGMPFVVNDLPSLLNPATEGTVIYDPKDLWPYSGDGMFVEMLSWAGLLSLTYPLWALACGAVGIVVLVQERVWTWSARNRPVLTVRRGVGLSSALASLLTVAWMATPWSGIIVGWFLD